MARPKAPDQQFQSSWNKAAAWAQTLGIPSSDYLPVYQLDSARLAAGQSAMSAAERNRAILAANNPRNVTSLPSDKPGPTSVFGNARQDLTMIVTGLEPQHLIANLFDTIKNTAEDLVDPKRLIGATPEATGANILQNTLLSFIPGAYDIGALLRGGPDALAEHPLVSLLDILPAGSSKLLTSALADTAVGSRLAAAGGITTDALRHQSMQKILSSVLTNYVSPKARVGIDPSSAAGGLEQLSIGQRLQSWVGASKLGTSKPIQDLMGEYMLGNQTYTAVAQNLIGPATHAFSALSPQEQVLYHDLFLRQSRGDDWERLLNDPTIPLSVRDAAAKMIRGPIKYETEEAIAARDVTPIRKPNGTVGLYASKQAEAVMNARDTLKTARVNFVAGLDATDRLRTAVESMDAQLPQITSSLTQANEAARQAIPADESLLENAIVNQDGHQLVFGRKADQARKVFGPGGLVDAVTEAASEGDLDHLGAVTNVLAGRLGEWGNKSVDASSNPAFMAVKSEIDKLATYVKRRDALTTEIDRRINGEPSRVRFAIKQEKAQLDKAHGRERSELTARHRGQREEQNQMRRAAISKARADLDVRLGELDRIRAQEDAEDLAIGDNAAARATKEQADAIYRQVRTKLNRRERALVTAKRHETERYQKVIAGINATWDKSAGALKARHDGERAALKVAHQQQRRGAGGELRSKMREYTNALSDFNQAVYDHPTDEYRDMRTQLYMDRLIEGHRNAELIDATEHRLRSESGWDTSRVEQLQSDPARLREAVALTVQDVYENPTNFDPELVEAVTEARDEATSSAVQEINTLISQGYRPMWLPAAGAFDRPGSSIRALVGKGTPHVDVAHARANYLVNTRYDVVVGASKAMTQTIRRDATIDFVEHSIVPRTISGDALRAQLDSLGLLEGFDPNVGTLTHAYSEELRKMGLTRFDPKGLFGFSMPRWEGQATYLPSSLVDALEKIMAEERKGSTGILDKATGLFKMSILGLSPRYTAHIVFGGTFLLALRSTPYMPSMLKAAATALRDNSLPQEIFRTPTQEGFSKLNVALREHGWQSGKQMSNLAIQENLSLVQKVAQGAATPFHWLKAAADVNYRFTRAAVRMQSAVAYLDYATAAERRGTFIDEVTGETRVMTKERAMREGMAHVEEVFGNLRNMSPLERQLSKNILPFYGWTRHILNYVMSFPADHPWRAMVLSLMAYENSENIPKGLPERIQFLFFMGKPDAQGNVSAIDDRFLDPLRDVANYATIGGWLQGLNPAFLAPLAIMNPQAVYGSNELYPNITYNQFFGIETASNQGNIVTGLKQFVPQLGALSAAIGAATNYRQAAKNPNQFYKSVFESLNVPFAQVQHINVKQIAAHDEIARYQVAKQAATNAFQSGDFASLRGYVSVPNPLNPDYEIAPADLKAIYDAALAQYPTQAPIAVLTPPSSPPGF